MAGKHGSKQQAWQLEQEAESSHPQLKAGSRESTKTENSPAVDSSKGHKVILPAINLTTLESTTGVFLKNLWRIDGNEP